MSRPGTAPIRPSMLRCGRSTATRFAAKGATTASSIQIDGEDAGYIQCYVIDDHPDYARQMRIDQGAVVILTPVLPRCEQSRWDHAIDNFRYPW